jgi:hypothetical protein
MGRAHQECMGQAPPHSQVSLSTSPTTIVMMHAANHISVDVDPPTCWNRREQAITDYLNIAQDLEMYGITYFEVHNKKGTKLWLGVHNLGMDIYEYNNKYAPSLADVDPPAAII